MVNKAQTINRIYNCQTDFMEQPFCRLCVCIYIYIYMCVCVCVCVCVFSSVE